MKSPLLFLLLALAGPVAATAAVRTEFVPAWAKSVVWYQIFPERFRNGDPQNDPQLADLAGADPVDPPKAWQIHPWGSDWYELQPYEKQNGETERWKHLQRRRYGGDLQGVIDQLPYLKELGVTALYLNPVFASPSLHKYDGASYHHIDPIFGPDPAGDRALMAKENPLVPATWVWTRADELALRLIDAAHAAGLRIIFDGVFNHMGRNSFAFRDLVRNQQRSPYRDWFTVKSWDDAAKGTTFDYEGWFGAKSLPELREDENGIVAGPRAYIFAATERWMNPKGRGAQHGIDGWRLDVAFCIAHPFWKAWRTHVRHLNPAAYLTAEVNDVPAKTAPYLQGDEFDADMNYNWGFACAEFFFEPGPARLSPSEFDRQLCELREAYPPGVAEVQMNLIGSHDTNRVGSLIVNRGIGRYRDWKTYPELSKAAENPAYSPRRPDDADVALQKFFVIFQMTYLGAPMIYYGDEVGLWGANDPDCRKPMLWPDLTYADEVYGADMHTRHAPDKVAIRPDLLEHYKRMIALRNRHPALLHGDYHTLTADDARGLFAFERTDAGDRVIVVLNNSGQAANYEFGQLADACYVDEISGRHYQPSYGALQISIPARWGVVLTECPRP
ncbi:MAG: alpha-glucosidase C-terminal domain-containing protein [Opitutae bacterium]|nr:alpha-glucosidase C-terminal domain-containing protein [Opitutae bacterium]